MGVCATVASAIWRVRPTSTAVAVGGIFLPCFPQLISLIPRIDFPIFIHREFGGNAWKPWRLAAIA
jgi:hypothetical protein